MKNVNFAQRVRVKMTPKTETQGGSSQARNELNIEINKHKVDIDKSCFVKTEMEKLELKNAKIVWRKTNS
jgi:hypothetical protein